MSEPQIDTDYWITKRKSEPLIDADSWITQIKHLRNQRNSVKLWATWSPAGFIGGTVFVWF